MPEHVVEFGRTGDTRHADGRLDAAAFHRNHGPIWAALSPYLKDARDDALELGSGTGQHVAEFARQSPALTWWPTDVNDNHLRSIEAWRAHAGLANLRSPLRIDLMTRDWPLAALGLPGEFTAMFCANVIHIAPWPVAEGLLALAGQHLRPDGRLFLYGPFMREGQHTAPSNAAFDEGLRRSDPRWGVRDITDLRDVAAAQGLRHADTIAMPANNLILVFAR
jgi:SAM-dependent methyltransferase